MAWPAKLILDEWLVASWAYLRNKLCKFSSIWLAIPRHNFAIGKQGCQIFLGTTYPNGKNIPNNHKIYPMATNYTKWP
jgi:hypothetical protein